jgi:hypothetical protein
VKFSDELVLQEKLGRFGELSSYQLLKKDSAVFAG